MLSPNKLLFFSALITLVLFCTANAVPASCKPKPAKRCIGGLGGFFLEPEIVDIVEAEEEAVEHAAFEAFQCENFLEANIIEENCEAFECCNEAAAQESEFANILIKRGPNGRRPQGGRKLRRSVAPGGTSYIPVAKRSNFGSGKPAIGRRWMGGCAPCGEACAPCGGFGCGGCGLGCGFEAEPFVLPVVDIIEAEEAAEECAAFEAFQCENFLAANIIEENCEAFECCTEHAAEEAEVANIFIKRGRPTGGRAPQGGRKAKRSIPTPIKMKRSVPFVKRANTGGRRPQGGRKAKRWVGVDGAAFVTPFVGAEGIMTPLFALPGEFGFAGVSSMAEFGGREFAGAREFI
jgi:hypothetical protein